MRESNLPTLTSGSEGLFERCARGTTERIVYERPFALFERFFSLFASQVTVVLLFLRCFRTPGG